MDIIQFLSAAAAVAAIIGVPIMIFQAFDGRKGRKLQEAQVRAQNPDFEIGDILESYMIQGDDSHAVVINLFVLITNRSDKPLTLRKIRLRLVGESREVTILPIISAGCIHDGYNVAPNSSATEWIRFSVGNRQHRDLRILEYVLVLTDVYGNTEERTMVYMREVVDNHG